MEILKQHQHLTKLTLENDFIMLTESEYDPLCKELTDNDIGFDDLIRKEIAFDLELEDIIKIRDYCNEYIIKMSPNTI